MMMSLTCAQPSKCALWISLAFAALLTACDNVEDRQINSVDDVATARIGVTSGTTTAQLAYERFPNATISEFADYADIIGALKANHIDATVTVTANANLIVQKNPDLKVIETTLREEQTCAAVAKGNTKLLNELNAIIDDIRADGTLEDMSRRWFKKEPGPYERHDYRVPTEGDVLKVGVSATREPMSFVDAEGRVTGHDGELARLFAERLNRPIEFVNSRWDALIPALESGKVDVIVTGMSYTDERAKRIDFTDTYYTNRLVLLARNGTAANSTSGKQLSETDQLANESIAILQGSAFDVFAQKVYPDADLQFYNTIADMLAAVEKGKATAGFSDFDLLRQALKANPQLAILGDPIFTSQVAAAFSKENERHRDLFNEFLASLRADGTLADMEQRWFIDGNFEMPDFEFDPNAPTFTIGNAIIGLPQVAQIEGKLAGFDVELALRFGQYTGQNIRFVTVDWAALIPALIGGKIDSIVSSMFVTPERRERVNFSDSYHTVDSYAFVLKKNLAGAASSVANDQTTGFWESTKQSFYDNIIREDRYLLLWDGLIVTIIISLLSAFFGTLLGGLICMMRMSQNGFLQMPARIYIEVMRGTPVLVLLMLIFYVLFASIDINPVLVAVFAFGLHFAAYIAEIFRAGVRSIDDGQTEAGIAMGFSKVQTFIYIIMPQTVQRILPVYKGEFISLVKMTSIVGYVAVQDLTKASDIIRSRTFDAFFPLIMVAILYFILAWVLTRALEYIEQRTDPELRRSKKS